MILKRTSIVLAFTVLLLAILACGSSTAAEPTQPPANTAEQSAPTEPPTPVAQEYFTEEFDNDTGNWSYYFVDGSKPNSAPLLVTEDIDDVEIAANEGRLAFDLGSEYIYAYATYDAYEYEDVRLDVIAENRGTNENNVSLICRYSDDEGWYEFNIANSGLYNILYGSVTDDAKVIYRRLADGGSNKIKQGKETNTYSAVCEGRTLTLYINGVETREIEDNDVVLRSGRVGVSVSSFDDLPAKVEIQSVQISQP
jgi:hypothetical protein